MKARLGYILFFIVWSFYLNGTNYYVSNSGDDSKSGKSPLNAWKTIDKVNSQVFQMGDIISFKSGEIFKGSIKPKSGYIKINSYGSGDKPVISGIEALGNWTNEGGGIFSTVVNSGIETNILTINNKIYAKGRFPNNGFLHHESADGKYSITDNELNENINWSGGEVVIEVNHWTLSVNKISQHVNNKLVYVSSTSLKPTIGSDYGYFIQNHIKTLDKFGEWSSDGSKLYMFFGGEDPNNYTIEISRFETLIDINGKNGINIENIALRGANSYGIKVYLSQGTKLNNCDIAYIGLDGVKLKSCTTAEVTGCAINECSGNGINTDASTPQIRSNIIGNIGLYQGMGGKSGETYHGINNTGGGTKTIIEFNRVDSTGYNGISCFRDNFTIRYNEVSKTNCLLNDGGGIYTYLHIDDTSKVCVNRLIHDNIIHDIYLGNGIYSDGYTNNLKVYNNTVFNIKNKNGIYCNTPRRNKIYNNLISNCSGSCIYIHNIDDKINAWGNEIKFNKVYKTKEGENLIKITDDYDRDVVNFGTSDSNIFIIGNDEVANLFYLRTNNPWSVKRSDSTGWEVLGYDKHSKFIRKDNVQLLYNPNQIEKEIPLLFKGCDLNNNQYSGSILINPFKSAFIFKVEEMYQQINLNKGWNFFSAFVDPIDKNMLSVLSVLIQDNLLEKVIDDEASLEMNSNGTDWVNGIGDLEVSKGYKIKVRNDCQLQISGYPLNDSISANLKSGWNLIPFPSPVRVDPMILFRSLMEEDILIKVKDEKGLSIENMGGNIGWVNHIGDLVPGKAYEIKVNTNLNFKLRR